MYKPSPAASPAPGAWLGVPTNTTAKHTSVPELSMLGMHHAGASRRGSPCQTAQMDALELPKPQDAMTKRETRSQGRSASKGRMQLFHLH